MKVCTKCKEEKPKDQFRRSSHTKDGLQGWCSDCHSVNDRCRYERERELRRTRRQEAFDRTRQFVYDYLLDHPCVDCGLNDPVVMEFDHVRGKKVDHVSQLLRNRGVDTIKAEIEKCEVVCANCHRRRTASRAGTFRWQATNG